MLYDMFDAHCKATNRVAHRFAMLEAYTVQQLEWACEELEHLRSTMNRWAAETHDDLHKFREQLYKRRRDGV